MQLDPLESSERYGQFYSQEDIDRHRTDNPSEKLRRDQFDRLVDTLSKHDIDVTDPTYYPIPNVSIPDNITSVVDGFRKILTFLDTESKVGTHPENSAVTLYASHHPSTPDELIMHDESGTRFLFEANTPIARFTEDSGMVTIENPNLELNEVSGRVLSAFTEIYILTRMPESPEKQTDR